MSFVADPSPQRALAASPRERLPMLLPREHGASMELAFPLLTALCLARPTWPAISLSASAVMVFVAHESFMVLAGRRGARRREAQRVAAWSTMLALGVVAAGLAALAIPDLTATALASLALPLMLGVPALAFALRGQERSLAAELVVAAALTSVSIPVALASGAIVATTLAAAGTWLVCFVVGTLAARGVLYRAKDRGRGLELAIVVAMIVAALSITAAALGWLPARLALAPLPSALVAALIALRPPSPKKMARLGLGLTAASIVSFALIVS